MIAVLELLLSIVAFFVPAALAVQGSRRLSRTSVEEWKLLAFVPSIPLIIWAVFISWGVSQDRTSHNLWPFEVVIWGALTLAMFGAFTLARKVFSRVLPEQAKRAN